MNFNNHFSSKTKSKGWIITDEVYNELCRTLGCRRPEQGGILGSSDGKKIDHYYHDYSADCTGGTYTMDVGALNKVIHDWNDNGIRLVGLIHSHPNGVIKPSFGDAKQASKIIETMDVNGEFFTPIVQVSPALNGEIRIYPYTFRQSIQMEDEKITIEKSNGLSKEERRRRELDKKSANRFIRLSTSLPYDVMKNKTLVIVGCGGSRDFVEAMARCGVSNFYLYDKDVVEDTNIATQGTYVSEIGKLKVDVIKNKILDINPMAKVHCIPRFLTDEITDEEFAFSIDLKKHNKKDILLCGCTDDASAQLRCELLSRKFDIPYLGAQIFAGGKGHEVVFTYPNLTKSCCMCMLGTRYKKIFSQKLSTGGSSAGTSVWVTNNLNSIKSYIALCILCYDEAETMYYRTLNKYAECNYLMSKCSHDVISPVFEPIENVFKTETDLSLPIGTVAIEQTREENCLVCSSNTSLKEDTRLLINEIIHTIKHDEGSVAV